VCTIARPAARRSRACDGCNDRDESAEESPRTHLGRCTRRTDRPLRGPSRSSVSGIQSV